MRRPALTTTVLLAAGCTAGPIDVAHLNPGLFGRDLVAHWTFDEREGNAWFFGNPVRLFLPDAPRKSSAPTVAAILLILALLGGGAWAAKEFDLFGAPK